MSYTKITEQDTTPKGKRGRPLVDPPSSKTCVICCEDKDIKLFYHQPGTNYISSYCDDCRGDYIKGYMEKINADPVTRQKNLERNKYSNAQYKRSLEKMGMSPYPRMEERLKAIAQLC